MPVDPGQMLSHYRLVEKIGEGGMGVVWQAEDTVLNRTVAIKVLPAELSRDEHRRQMFLREAQLASSIGDAHIVQVFEFGREGDLDFIVMEHVGGKPLNKLIHGRPLPPEKAAEFGLETAKALARAHRKGLIHRDLKPANIMVTPEGDVKVLDFGLAVLFVRGETTVLSEEATRTEPDMPREGVLAGTLLYMSPEQTRCEELDSRSDVFSLGVILYEMATGQRPFAGATPSEILSEIQSARPTPPHERSRKLPLELDRIIQKALARRRGDRYQSMDDLAVDLKRLGRELESGSSPSYEDLAKSYRPARWSKQTLAIGAGVLLLSALAFAGWQMLPTGSPLDERTILILPMEVRGQTEGAEYFGRAFAEAIAVNLAQAVDLKVMPVPAASPEDESEAAREIGAGRLLTGAITRKDEAVQASVSLLDAVENRLLWGGRKEGPDDQLPMLAAALAQEVAEKLGVDFPRFYGIPEDALGHPDRAASPLWTTAVGALWIHDLAASLKASQLLVEAFPDEPDAHAIRVKARIDAFEQTHSEPNTRAVEEAVAALDRLDAKHPVAELARGFIESGLGYKRPAIARFTTILDRHDLTPALRAEILMLRGWNRTELDEHGTAFDDLEEAVRLNPTNGKSFAILGMTLLSAGRPEDALIRSHQAVALSPTSSRAQFNLSLVLGVLEEWEEAQVAAGKSCELSGDQASCANYATALLMAGHEAESRAAANEATNLADDKVGAYNLACYWARVGNRAKAFRYLQSSLDQGWNIGYLARDPDLESLHGDPEFEAIVAEVEKRIGEE